MLIIQNFIRFNRRTLKKTFSYYLMHIVGAMIVAYFVTKNLWMAMTLSLLEPSVQAIAFFFHEKIWNKKEQPQTTEALH